MLFWFVDIRPIAVVEAFWALVRISGWVDGGVMDV
jgi:hypothetical protein